MKKKLLQINVVSNRLSTGRITDSIASIALRHGWESMVVCGRNMGSCSGSVVKVGSLWDLIVHYFGGRLFDKEGLCSRKTTRDLIRLLDNYHPDIVHLHNLHDHYLNYEILFKYLQQAKIPVVWTFHDCWAFTGHCFHFVSIGCEKWKDLCFQCPMRRGKIDRSTVNYVKKKSLYLGISNMNVVACSEWMGGLVRNSFFNNCNIQVIHNGIDLSTFRPLPSSRSGADNIFRVLAVANIWSQSKGLSDIIFLRKLLSEDFEITIVGVSSAQMLTIPKGITAIKRTSSMDELVRYYNDADVLINTTYADTFPTVNLEALACGTPVITYNTGGSPESIDEKTGIVVGKGSVQQMANAIRYAKEHPFDRSKCRARAELLFDRNCCFEEYFTLYSSILDNTTHC